MERAKDLLRSANLTVTEVCLLVGFSSLGSFSSRFSELVGMSPTAYRREQAARGGRRPGPGRDDRVLRRQAGYPVGFSCSGLPEAVERLRAAGVPVTDPVTEPWGSYLRVTDPEGRESLVNDQG